MPRVKRTPVVVLVDVKKPKSIDKDRICWRCPDTHPETLDVGTVRKGNNRHWFYVNVNTKGFKYWEDWCCGLSKQKIMRKMDSRNQDNHFRKVIERIRQRQIAEYQQLYKNKETVQTNVYKSLRRRNIISGGKVIDSNDSTTNTTVNTIANNQIQGQQVNETGAGTGPNGSEILPVEPNLNQENEVVNSVQNQINNE